MERQFEEQSTDRNIITTTQAHLNVKFIKVKRVHVCDRHEYCQLQIKHHESCLEPFVCIGNLPCVRTCQTKLKREQKASNTKRFWKSISAEVFPIDKDKCDVSTEAETYNRNIITEVHYFLATPETAEERTAGKTFLEKKFSKGDPNVRREKQLARLQIKLYERKQASLGELKLPDTANLAETPEEKELRQECLLKHENYLLCEDECSKIRKDICIDSSQSHGIIVEFSRSPNENPTPFTNTEDNTEQKEKKKKSKINQRRRARNKDNISKIPVQSGSKNNIQDNSDSRDMSHNPSTSNLKSAESSNKEGLGKYNDNLVQELKPMVEQKKKKKCKIKQRHFPSIKVINKIIQIP